MLRENGSPQQPSQARRKRTRTGCLKCRARRRKCDEGKPRCKNCALRDFECRYPAPLTFLPKNTYTVLSNQSGSGGGGSPRYINLRLIDGENKEEECSPDESVSMPGIQSDVETSRAEETDVALVEDVISLPQVQGALEVGNRDVTEKNSLNRSLDAFELPQDENHGPMSQNSVLIGDPYESALHGLIALGTGNVAGSRTGTPADGNRLASIENASTIRTMPDARLVLPSVDEQGAFNVGPSASINEDNESLLQDSLSRERTLELLSHFRYEIAPWLDICDMAQGFGVALPRVALISDSVRFAMLALASSSMRVLASRNTSWCVRESRDLVSLSEACQSNDQPFESCVGAVLRTLWYFLSDIPRAWQQVPFHETGLLNMIASARDHGRRGLLSSLYWLLLRLELSSAFLKSEPMRIPTTNISMAEGEDDLFGRISHYAYQAIVLSTEAVNICWGSTEPQGYCASLPRSSLVERWNSLLEKLERWYKYRPEEFLPIVEHEANQDSPFPVIVFTNGASILSNQLHHTAILIMLLHKPRTVRLPGVSPYTSPLWHAERLCGIALTNDRRECWEPCLLASLVVAARRMTHKSQQRALLSGFRRIRDLTGFDVEEPLAAVRECWEPAGPL